ncbi:hypothetical protein LTR67_008299 [Exophiala xenobiotica]
MPPLSIEDYHVGWVCALPKELIAARAMLDEEHEQYKSQVPHDNNNYMLGRIHGHNIVIACPPAGVYSTVSAAAVANNMLRTFSAIRFGLLVGIGGGIPNLVRGVDIRLSDVVVSQPDGTHGGVVQYDLRKSLGDSVFERKGSLGSPPTVLLTALTNLQSRHQLYGNQISGTLSKMIQRLPRLVKVSYMHPGPETDVLYCSNVEGHQEGNYCTKCQNGIIDREPREGHSPKVHYGVIASGDQLIKNEIQRDRLGLELGAICVEMEAAGLIDDFPCIAIRGICDYADTHKNDVWQNYAAATAAAFTKELLLSVEPAEVNTIKPATEVMSEMESISRPHPTSARASNRPTLSFPGSRQEPEATVEGQLEKEYNVVWEGRRIYEESEGSLGDVLTITKTSRSCYAAKTVSEYLQDFDPTIGPVIIQWLEEVCKNTPEWTGSPRPHPMDDPTAEQAVGQYGGAGSDSQNLETLADENSPFTLHGNLHGNKLKLRIKSESNELMEKVECVLGWVLTALQVLEDGAEGLYLSHCEPDTLGNGLEKPVKFTPEASESCCWTSLFSSALVVDQTRWQTQSGSERSGLEMDLGLLQELSGVDREMKTDYGIIQYGFDIAIFPIEPEEDRKWHVVVTSGKQITPLRLINALDKGDGLQFQMAQRCLPGKVYVGWCSHFKITFYSNVYNAIRDPDNPIPSSGLRTVDGNFQRTERSEGRDTSVNIR